VSRPPQNVFNTRWLIFSSCRSPNRKSRWRLPPYPRHRLSPRDLRLCQRSYPTLDFATSLPLLASSDLHIYEDQAEPLNERFSAWLNTTTSDSIPIRLWMLYQVIYAAESYIDVSLASSHLWVSRHIWPGPALCNHNQTRGTFAGILLSEDFY